MRQRSGDSSHNLFGIKADSRWDGDKVPVSTLEYRDGVALKTRANFRAYESFEAQLFRLCRISCSATRAITEALGKTGDPSAYFSALQQAGYATDPVCTEDRRYLDSDAMQDARRTATQEDTSI